LLFYFIILGTVSQFQCMESIKQRSIFTSITLICSVLVTIPFLTGKSSLSEILSWNYNSEIISATVIASGDGFLALRSLPSIKTGKRLDKIPHQKKINIYDCQNFVSIDSDGVSGYWCKCNYNENEGWVFDGYLKVN